MNQQTFTLNPPTGVLHQTALGFTANSVIIDNYTSSFVNIPDAGITLPAWAVGAVVALPAGTTTAEASLTATVPATSGPPVPSSQTTLTWTDATLPASSGNLLQQSSYSQPQEVLSVSANNQTKTGTVTLPAGAQSLAIVTVVGTGDSSNFSLTGVSSGFAYYSQSLGSSAYEIIGIEQAIDTTLNYSAQSVTGPGNTWYVTALFSPPPTFITRTPAPWQVPTTPATINQNVPHGSFFTWITPPSGRSIRLFDLHLQWQSSTAGFGEVKGDGTTGTLFNYDQKATNYLNHDFHGLKLQPNEKLLITNDDTGNGQNVNGGVDYALD